MKKYIAISLWSALLLSHCSPPTETGNQRGSIAQDIGSAPNKGDNSDSENVEEDELVLPTEVSGAYIAQGQLNIEGQPNSAFGQVQIEQVGVSTSSFILKADNRFEVIISGSNQAGNEYAEITLIITAQIDGIDYGAQLIFPPGTTGQDLGTITLKQLTRVQGQIYLEGRDQHGGVRVAIPGTRYQTQTAVDGFFTLEKVPEGHWRRLEISYEGFSTLFQRHFETVSGKPLRFERQTMQPAASQSFPIDLTQHASFDPGVVLAGPQDELTAGAEITVDWTGSSRNLQAVNAVSMQLWGENQSWQAVPSEITGSTLKFNWSELASQPFRIRLTDQAGQEAVSDWWLPLPSTAEVHMVGAHHSMVKDQENALGLLNVRVEDAQNPIVLFLCSYESSSWIVQGPALNQVRAIILCGEQEQSLALGDDLPIPVLIRTKSRLPERGFYFYENPDGFTDTDYQSRVEDIVRRSPHSIQSHYQARSFQIRSLKPLAPGVRVHIMGAERPGLFGPAGDGVAFGEIDIEVRSQTPVFLVLMAHAATRWNINLPADIPLHGVVLAGFEDQEVTGLPDSATILERGFHSYGFNDPLYESVLERIRTITGRKEHSFQGTVKPSHFLVE